MRMLQLAGLSASLMLVASPNLLAGDKNPPDVSQPRASVIAPLAIKTTLLSLSPAGSHFITVGQRGHILKSENSQDWQQHKSPHNAMLTRARFNGERQGWAVGHDSTIIGTSDGGNSWSLQYFDPAGRTLYDLVALDAKNLIAVGGYGTYLTSSDGGKNWQKTDNSLSELGYHLNALVQLKSGLLFAIGERGLLARSADQGTTWELVDSPYAGSLFGGLPLGDNGVVAYGMRGNVYSTEDLSKVRSIDFDEFDPFMKETVEDQGEMTEMGWRHYERPIKESLFGGAWHDGKALLVGVNGTAVKFDPRNGLSLEEADSDETLNDVLWHNDHWLAVGKRGVQHLGALSWQ